MPDEIRSLGKSGTGDLAPPARVEDAKFDRFGVLGKDGEVHAVPIPGCAEWVGLAGPEVGFRFAHDVFAMPGSITD
jgi:hypothetical protein